MTGDGAPTSVRDPRFVSTVVGVAATAAVHTYASLSETGPTGGAVSLVLFGVLVPRTVAYEVARRWP